MGATYHITCPRCGWTRNFCVGSGACDERRANEILLALETGPDADNIQAILLSEPDARMYIERGEYRCRYCGNVTERICTRLIGGERMLTCNYKCEKCGRLMGRLHEYELKKLPCPICGNESLTSERMGEWNIAPAAEIRSDANAAPRNIVPLATECFKIRDERGQTAFIPIKSELQLQRLREGGTFSTTMLKGLDEARASNGGYWVLEGEACDALLATFPAQLIRADENRIRALETSVLKAYPELCGAYARSAYIDSEPFNIINVDGREGLLTYGIWTLPELSDAATALRGALQSRISLDIRGDK